MAFEIRWTANAEEDYKNVVTYLATEWNIDIAINFMENMEKRIETLSVFPYLGIASGKLNDVRSISLTKHNKLYYRISGETIEILSIFDTRKSHTKNKYK